MNYRLFLLYFIFLLSDNLLFAQALSDSVDHALAPLQGSERLKAMPGCMMALYQHNPPYLEKVLKLGDEGIQLAEQLDDKKGQAVIRLHMAWAYYFTGIYDHRPKNNLLAAIALCKKINNTHATGVCYRVLGDVCRGGKEYTEAIACYQKAIKLLNGDAREELKETYSNLGACYLQLNSYDNALDCYIEALAYVPVDDLEMQAHICNNIGNVYENLKNYDFALQHYQKCLVIATQLSDQKSTARSYNNIGNIYKEKGRNSKALRHYKQSLELWQLLSEKYEEAGTFQNIGNVHEQQGEYNAALQYYEKALKIFTGLGEKAKAAAVLTNVVSVTAAMENPGKAIALFDSILVYAGQHGDPVLLKTICLNLSELYEAAGNTRMALAYARRYEAALAGLYNVDINKLAALQKDYRLLEKTKELEIARRDSRLHHARARQRTIIIFALAGLLVALAIIALLAHMNFRNKLLHRLADLKSRVMRGQMNPHFLFNALMAIQNRVMKGENDASVQYISVLARLLRQVLEASNEEYISVEQETEILNRYFEMQQLRYGDRFDYTVRIDPSVDPEAMGIPPMLLQPLVENAIEHGTSNIPYKGLVEVEVAGEKGMLVCTVADNGIGINRHKAKTGSQHDEHQSLAMGIVSERLDILGKKMKKKASMEIIDMETMNSRGTRVILRVPGKEFY